MKGAGAMQGPRSMYMHDQVLPGGLFYAGGPHAYSALFRGSQYRSRPMTGPFVKVCTQIDGFYFFEFYFMYQLPQLKLPY